MTQPPISGSGFFPLIFTKHSVDYEKSCNFFFMASKHCFGSLYDQQFQGSRISAKTPPHSFLAVFCRYIRQLN